MQINTLLSTVGQNYFSQLCSFKCAVTHIIDLNKACKTTTISPILRGLASNYREGLHTVFNAINHEDGLYTQQLLAYEVLTSSFVTIGYAIYSARALTSAFLLAIKVIANVCTQ